MNFDIKTHIRGTSSFSYYKEGMLWYQTSDSDLLFPVPISDAGTAQFLATEKSMLMMRYIRKYLADVKAAG